MKEMRPGHPVDVLASLVHCGTFSGLTAFAPGFTGFVAIIGEVAGIVRRAAALLTGLLSALRLLTLLAAAVLATLLAGFRGTLRIVGEISGATALFVCHLFSPSLLPGPWRLIATPAARSSDKDEGWSEIIRQHIACCLAHGFDAANILHQGDLALLLMSDSVRHQTQAWIAGRMPLIFRHLDGPA
ncbi:hypothetical protein ACVIW2_003379 [Bradyrhizobium huanghuaihaiense]|uniref:hypothetical protein n=1 Tax=Bradyrhizobium huanghuaihaiense TaxID=990078 RepID=UPI003D3109D3